MGMDRVDEAIGVLEDRRAHEDSSELNQSLGIVYQSISRSTLSEERQFLECLLDTFGRPR